MGGALIQGWIDAGLIKHAEILDPQEISDTLSNLENISPVKNMAALSLAETDILILAVKPQIMDTICEDLKDILPPALPVLSIAAGKSTSYFKKHLGANTPIIRAMPNTPAAIGQGMSALYATSTLSNEQKQIADTLLSAVGETLWLEKEAQINTVTALSGSGPAYVFYMIEAMTKAGESAGLSTEQSMQLARQTVIGAAALAAQQSDTPASILRQNVTSPGGTTEAALKILMDGKFQDIINSAIQAAKKRSEELSD